MLYTRLDTLESVDISHPTLSRHVLWGAPFSSALIKMSALYLTPADNLVPYLRRSPSSKWAVRLVPQIALDTRAAQLAYLSIRDGWACFYCDRELTATTATVEHIVSTSHGGPTHADNLCLSCESCNAAMGSMPAVTKMRLAIGARVGTIAMSVFKSSQGNGHSRKRGTK